MGFTSFRGFHTACTSGGVNRDEERSEYPNKVRVLRTKPPFVCPVIFTGPRLMHAPARGHRMKEKASHNQFNSTRRIDHSARLPTSAFGIDGSLCQHPYS